MDKLECRLQDIWQYIECDLPSDLEETAYKTNALIRHKGVSSAANLLRIILTYGVTDLPLKATAAWASAAKLAELSSVALFYRVRDAQEWLAYLISTTLNAEAKPLMCSGLNISIVDATVVSGPRSKGTDWRLHTGIDPNTGHINSLRLTDHSIGETYKNYPVKPGEILVGDRAYALANGIAYVHSNAGYVVARANLYSIRLCRPDKTIFNPLLEEPGVGKVGVAHYDVLIPVPPEKRTKSHKTWKLECASAWIPARLLAVRTTKGNVIWVITTVPESLASDSVIMELYRVRWQIELEFKRLKSLLKLHALPSRRGPTAQSWILARIYAAILIERFLRNSGAFSPWGYRLRFQTA